MKTQLFTAMVAISMFFAMNAVWSQPNPYLQTPTPTSIYVSWHSTDSSSTLVRYGLADTALTMVTSGTFQNISGKIWHTVKLAGLVPATNYYYRCISGADSSAVFPFRSQPVPGLPGQHVRFAVIGDSRDNDTIPTFMPYVVEKMKLCFIAKYGERWFDSLNFIMHTGDIVWKGSQIARYEDEFFTPIKDLSCSVPVMISIGNHERESHLYYSYMKYTDFTDSSFQQTGLNQKFYSFRILNCMFLALNSNSGLISESLQHQWIHDQLVAACSDTGVAMVFPYSHHPYRSSIWPSGNADSVKTVFFPEFNNCYKVVQYTYGHAHCYERGVWNMSQPATTMQHDIPLLLSGGGGAELSRYNTKSKNYPEVVMAVDDYMFAIIDVDVDDQSFSMVVHTLGKPEHPINLEILDSLHFRMNQPPPLKPDTYHVIDSTTIILNSSTIQGADSCMSAQVQITQTPGNYANTVIDTTRNLINYFENTGSPDFTPVNLNAGINLYSFTVPAGKLNPEVIHGYRVRYRDLNYKWSEWSDENIFIPNGINDDNGYYSDDIILRQNYPNPFTGETMIQFVLKYRQSVTFDLVNLKGEPVLTLPERKYTSGAHQFILTTEKLNLPAGYYILRMKGAKSVKTIAIRVR